MARTKSPPAIAPEVFVKGEILEALFHVTRQTIILWSEENPPAVVKVGPNLYDLFKTFEATIAKNAAQIANLQNDSNPEQTAAKLALTLAQLEGVRLKNEKTSGELISRTDIQPGWSRVALAFRMAMMQIPEKAKREIPKLTAKETKVLKGLIRDGLTHAGVVAEPPSYGPESFFEDANEEEAA